MPRIEEFERKIKTARPLIGTILYVILIVFIAIPFFIGITYKPSYIAIVSICLIVFSVYFYFSEKDLRFVFTLLLLFLNFYNYTYVMEYIPFQEVIDSSVYIEKGYNIGFSSSGGYLLFNEDVTSFTNNITFNVLESSTNNSLLLLRPPNNTVSYNITLFKEQPDLGEKEINSKNMSPWSTTGSDIKNSENLKYQINLDSSSRYNLKITYLLPKMKPFAYVRATLIGHNYTPNPEFLYVVAFNQINYECSPNPCLRTFSDNTSVWYTSNAPVDILPTLTQPYTFFMIKSTDPNELSFLISTINKKANIIRILVLAFIVGLILGLMDTLMRNREKYKQDIKSFKNWVLKRGHVFMK